ncbi:MAG: hypothetical protein JW910_21345 [Anaerolineae bacterium]|nr:hypothetical protein [Anaerolineae bacterium]
MRLLTRLTGVLLVIAVMLGLSPFAAAQGDFSPEEQAALDAVRAALQTFVAADSYTTTLTQDMQQDMAFTAPQGAVTVTQTVVSEGTMQYARRADGEIPDRALDLTQTVAQVTAGAGADQTQTVGPMRTQLIVAGGRIYMQMEVPPELGAFIPEGWQDVTEGAAMFPGLDMFNLDGVLAMGQAISLTYLDEFLAGVTSVEVLEPETLDGQTVTRYRVATDPRLLVNAIGEEAMLGMFNPGNMAGMDVAVFLEALLSGPDNTYVLEVVLDEAGALVSYAETTVYDADVSAAFTDPSLAGVTITLQQTLTQAYTVRAVNVPLTITAPEIVP